MAEKQTFKDFIFNFLKSEAAPDTADAMKRYKSGKAGFTDKAHLKAKGLIPRSDGTKRKSPKYEDAPANAVGDGGNVALPPKHEPGVHPLTKSHNKYKKKNQDERPDPLMFAKPIKRKIKEEDDNNNVVLKKIIESIDKSIEKKREQYEDVVKFDVEEPKKSFKERYGLTFGYSVGPIDSMKPMASLGDTPPPRKGSKRYVSNDTSRIPRKPGQKAGSDKHSDLYTDENPRGTIHGLGFTDKKKANQSINNIKGSGKTHAHKMQAAIAMSQRAKVASKRAKDPEKKKDLGQAHKVYQNYIDKNKKKD